jgi:DNA-binding transcriptional LysR family regulator
MLVIHRVYSAVMQNHHRLTNLDLNLLVTLDILLRECNVTRSAEQMGLSQPAVSASLARLRRHFGDDLLTRVGNRYELTPLASRLAKLTPFALNGVSQVFDAAPEFDPRSMDRQFSMFASDYASAVLGPEIARVVGEQAPGVQIRFQVTTPYAVDHAVETLRTVDGIVLPHGFLSDFPHAELYRDDWVVIVDADNAAVGDELTIEHLSDLPWVIFYDLPTAFAPSAQQLRMTGVEARASIVVHSFLSMPFLVRGSDRIAMMQRRIAEQMADPLGLRVMDPPFESVPVAEAFWWHPIYHDDPAHVWLRSVITTAARRLTGDNEPVTAPDD